jgi:branched-chain amino acid transport system permease protein
MGVKTRLLIRVFSIAGATAFLATYPLWRSGFEETKFTRVGIYLIAIIGLNILIGYSGQITLGHGAFMGIGAYTTAILVTKTAIPDYATIPIAGLVAGIIGFLFGFPALRLHGVYLALATFGAAVAFIQLLQSTHYAGFTGGATGLFYGLPKNPYYLTWGIAGGLYVAGWLLLRSKAGRAFTAVRDAPIAAVSSGVNLALAKTFAFGIASAYAGVAGALFAIVLGSVNPISFPVSLSILLLTGAALGGLGSLGGMIFGALFIQFAPDFAADHVSKTSPAVGYGLILLAVLFLMPGGAGQLLQRLASLLNRATAALYTRSARRAEAVATSTRSRK